MDILGSTVIRRIVDDTRPATTRYVKVVNEIFSIMTRTHILMQELVWNPVDMTTRHRPPSDTVPIVQGILGIKSDMD